MLLAAGTFMEWATQRCCALRLMPASTAAVPLLVSQQLWAAAVPLQPFSSTAAPIQNDDYGKSIGAIGTNIADVGSALSATTGAAALAQSMVDVDQQAGELASARERAAAAQPVLAQNKLLQLLLTSEQQLTSQQLYDLAKHRFPNDFPSRMVFKREMKRLKHLQLVEAKPDRLHTRTGPPTGAFVFHATWRAMRVDLNAAGTPVLEAARSAADEWTRQHLPRYVEYLRQGLVPAAPEDEALRRGQQAEKGTLFERT
jgi:hypothetical protein